MREKRKRRELAVLQPDREPFKPTDEQREQVKIYKWNGLGEERIAALLGLTLDELRYHFAAEMEYSEDQLLGFAASRIFYLAGQNQDLGVALRASQHIAMAKSRRWRIPKEGPEDPGAGDHKRLSSMSLDDVEQELADMERRRGAQVSTPPSEGEDP